MTVGERITVFLSRGLFLLVVGVVARGGLQLATPNRPVVTAKRTTTSPETPRCPRTVLNRCPKTVL
jgi:hypothetical protein